MCKVKREVESDAIWFVLKYLKIIFLFYQFLGFFVLQRFYLRVDNTLIRVYDTRIYFEVENSFLLREYSEREQEVGKLTVGR